MWIGKIMLKQENEMNTEYEHQTWMSYGGGVQTFGMLLMVKYGLIEKPHGLIFSDTKAEYPKTYQHIEKYAKPICEELEIPFIEVQDGDGLIEGYKQNNSIPLAGFRSCTFKYKIDPIKKYYRELTKGIKRKRGKAIITSLIGISTDESKRAIPRRDQKPKWIENKYPFLEMDISRKQIIAFIEEKGYEVPPKSGCYVCPYHGLKGFVDLKVNHPDLFKVAIEMEEAYFEHRPERIHGFLSDSRIRLKELGEIPSLFSFVEQLPQEHNECDSGGCFL